MKKIYLQAFTFVISIAVAILILLYLLTDGSKETSNVYLDDEDYLIYPSDSTGKWNIIFPSGNEYAELKPEQIAVFLKSGEIPMDTTWVIYPQCQYQLELYEDELIISDFGRLVAELPLNQTGKLETILIKDNE